MTRFIRLAPPEDTLFAGREIDRTKPLAFTLNGIGIAGFAGDTILSAALASGLAAAGSHRGFPLALGERLGLQVFDATAEPSARAGLPAERTPAVDGAELVTAGYERPTPFSRLRGFLTRTDTTTLAVDFEQAPPLPVFSGDTDPDESRGTDLLVIGGGLAGLAAAAHAAAEGKSVMLVERRPYLGGDAVLFGHVAGEESPETAIARLAKRLADAPNATVLTRAEAMLSGAGRALVHCIDISSGTPFVRIIEIISRRIVIAAGAADRLPVFPGNRLPGVTGLGAAFHLGSAYGVAVSAPALVATSVNAGYRFALLAEDGGLKIERLADPRLSPQSRFAEFAKAYGIKLAPGIAVHGARPDGSGLAFDAGFSVEGAAGRVEPVHAGGMVISGGWMPRLSLWQQAGGRIVARRSGNLHADGNIPGIALAGILAGFTGMPATMESGIAAVERLFGGKSRKIEDVGIDPAFESPDDNYPGTEVLTEGSAPAYCDEGNSFACFALPRRREWLPPATASAGTGAFFASRALSLGDLAARVALGNLAAEDFEDVARERAVTPLLFGGSVSALPPERKDKPGRVSVPAYLASRFEGKGVLWEVTTDNGVAFEAGCQVFANSDLSDPLDALGVVIASKPGEPGSSIVLFREDAGASGRQVSVRNARGHAPARIFDRLG